MRHIIVYSEINANNIELQIGQSEYSYYFVLKEFLPVLEQIGNVHHVDHFDQVDPLYRLIKHNNPAESAVFLSFSPPHKTAINLECPTICVFAWEFPSIPVIGWSNDDRNDWRVVFSAHGRAITLAKIAADAVKKEMGDDYPILVLPTPVWNKMQHARDGFIQKLDGKINRPLLKFKNILIDTKDMSLNPDMIVGDAKINAEVDENLFDLPHLPSPDTILQSKLFLTRNGKRTSEYSIEVAKNEEGYLIYGPYIAWNAGKYVVNIYAHLISPQNQPIIVDACCERGTIVLARQEISSWQEAYDTMSEVDKELYLFCQMPIELKEDYEDLEIRVWIPKNTVGSIYAVEIKSNNVEDVKNLQNSVVSSQINHKPYSAYMDIKGVLYTSVFNPKDSRKNVEDMLTAFCYTFKDNDNVTLLLKVAQKDIQSYYRNLILILSRLSPFKCRVICVGDFLDELQYTQLVIASDFYFNTSLNEGLCIPLVEFLCGGVPAVAPYHTSMQDYLSDEYAFTINSTLETAAWAHDPEWRRTTKRHRLIWTSICDALASSYNVIINNPTKYHEMSKKALSQLSVYANETRARIELERLIDSANTQK